MSATYLDDIVAHHRARAAVDRRDWRDRLGPTYAGPSLGAALGASGRVGVIAEVKRRSPSRGWLRDDLDAAAQAELYQAAGAAAISVLTDEPHFAGSLEDLRAASAATTVPTLRKDFTVSDNDVLDARDAGAAAVLLIVAVLDDAELSRYLELAERVGLDALVEVHDEAEAERALALGARLIGVNRRNLHTFEVDADRATRVAATLPASVVRVCESGLSSVADVERAARDGFDAVLVGEALVTAPDAASTLRAFAAVVAR